MMTMNSAANRRTNDSGYSATDMIIAGPDTATISGMLRDGMGRGHMPFLTVSSGSMAPLLRVGDEIGLQPVKVHQLRSGDVIAIANQDLVLTHRFIGLRDWAGGKLILTRGDRTGASDEPWTADRLLGRAVARRRDGQTLWLDFGAGNQLNKALARLSWLEHRILRQLRGSGASHPMTYSERLILALFRRLCQLLTGTAEWMIR